MIDEIANLIEQTRTWKLRWFIPEGRYGVYQCENSTVSVIVSCCAPSDYLMVVNGNLLQGGIEDLRELCSAISEQIHNRKKQGMTPEDKKYLRSIVPVME